MQQQWWWWELSSSYWMMVNHHWVNNLILFDLNNILNQLVIYWLIKIFFVVAEQFNWIHRLKDSTILKKIIDWSQSNRIYIIIIIINIKFNRNELNHHHYAIILQHMTSVNLMIHLNFVNMWFQLFDQHIDSFLYLCVCLIFQFYR